MCVFCTIVPPDVLKRFSDDKSLKDEVRKSMRNTLALDGELRKLRAQARNVSRASHSLSAIATIAASPAINVFDCKQSRSLPGSPIADPAKSSDATVKRVFVNTSDVAKFYQTVFGRNSVDNAGMTLISSVHYDVAYNNAFWNGSQMTYGDGDGSIFVDLSLGNDVIGHELTHGVTQHSLQLAYTNEAGGLNESISDVFGSMFRQWQGAQDVKAADWLIGADIMGTVAKQKGFTCLRDMDDPAATHCLGGAQPTKFSQFQPGMDPHVSSGIANLAFCKIAKAIGGKSWEKAGKLWYDVMTASGPSPNMKMSTFANKIRQSASSLFPGDSAIANAVDAGWKQVGL